MIGKGFVKSDPMAMSRRLRALAHGGSPIVDRSSRQNHGACRWSSWDEYPEVLYEKRSDRTGGKTKDDIKYRRGNQSEMITPQVNYRRAGGAEDGQERRALRWESGAQNLVSNAIGDQGVELCTADPP